MIPGAYAWQRVPWRVPCNPVASPQPARPSPAVDPPSFLDRGSTSRSPSPAPTASLGMVMLLLSCLHTRDATPPRANKTELSRTCHVPLVAASKLVSRSFASWPSSALRKSALGLFPTGGLSLGPMMAAALVGGEGGWVSSPWSRFPLGSGWRASRRSAEAALLRIRRQLGVAPRVCSRCLESS